VTPGTGGAAKGSSVWLFICSKYGLSVEQEEIISGGCEECRNRSWHCNLLSKPQKQGEKAVTKFEGPNWLG
jgi:hypothetical protein